MDDVSIKDAKEQLEELLDRAARGEDVRITDPKIGVVRLTRISAPTEPSSSTEKRQLGRYKGKYSVPERLMEPMSEEELRLWYGDAT